MSFDSTDSRPRAAIAAVAGIAIAAAVVRVAAAPGDLYIDEIWSLGFARSHPSPWAILTQIHYDNNHYLTTMWMSLLGDNVPAILYRLPALLCGIAIVPLGALTVNRHGHTTAVFTALLLGSSFLLIEYSTEARGYAPVVMMVFLSWLVMRRWMQNEQAGWAVVFWFAVVIGLVSQLIFVQFYLGLLAWSGWHLARQSVSWGYVISRGLLLHGVPLITIALIYYYDVRYMAVGGGPQYDTMQLLVRVFSFALGGPAAGQLAFVFTVAGVTAFMLGTNRLWRCKDDERVLYIIAMVVAPLIAVALVRSSYLYARYFLVGITFLLCLTGQLLGELWRRGNHGKILAVSFAAMIVAANAWHTKSLLANGRGQYVAALQMIARDSDSDELVISTDHDFRHGLVMGFHSRSLPNDKRLVVIAGFPDQVLSLLDGLLPNDSRIEFAVPNESLPQWIVKHQIDSTDEMPQDVALAGTRYKLVKRFPCGSLSGWDVILYRK